ncbi:MAG: molybdopterin molybdenumtransferase MoeA [Planctomycetota bacterium]|nr:MAG: molybdopterin molybdenumtransferase MoeA [Planctomycetota bacterium]
MVFLVGGFFLFYFGYSFLVYWDEGTLVMEAISRSQALRIALERAPLLSVERRELLSSFGYYLAEDIFASFPHPLWDTAAMDGFALRSRDTVSAPVELEVVERIPAGCMPERVIRAGQAAEIMTGAPLPEGADAVVKVEDTSGFGGGRVQVFRCVSVGEAVRRRGENIQADELAVAKGSRLRPEEIAILATLGQTEVWVGSSPRVAILATGDEVVSWDEEPGPGQIRNSNGPMLFALIREQFPCVPDLLGGIGDRESELKDRIARALLGYDLVLLTGGVSAGTKDFVPGVLEELGVELHFRRVHIKPGKPVIFGTWRGEERCVVVFGLPGNPVSSLVAFLTLVRPVMAKMMGASSVEFMTYFVRVGESLSPHSRERYLPLRLRGGEGEWVPTKGSGDLFCLRLMDGFGVVEANKGVEGEVIFLPRR